MKHALSAIILATTGLCTAFAAEPQNGSGETNGYKLVWQDLFDSGTLNRGRWTVEETNSPANGELQSYRDRDENVRVGDDGKGNGCLILTARRDNPTAGRVFSSGRVNSMKKVTFTHGKIEAAIKLPPTANGLWPAFWMMGNDFADRGWPRCGETDIMEMGHQTGIAAGTSDRYFNGASHWGYYNENWQYPNYARNSTAPYSLQDGEFHLFTCIWDNDKISMYLDLDKYPDAEPYYEFGITPEGDNDITQDIDWGAWRYYHKPNFILFNLAVGGHFPGITNPANITALNDDNGQQASMYVNYVKVYQKGTDAAETLYTLVDSDPLVTPDPTPDPETPDPEKPDAALETLDSTTVSGVEWFALDGRRVENPGKGIFIRKCGNDITKFTF